MERRVASARGLVRERRDAAEKVGPPRSCAHPVRSSYKRLAEKEQTKEGRDRDRGRARQRRSLSVCDCRAVSHGRNRYGRRKTASVDEAGTRVCKVAGGERSSRAGYGSL